MPLVDRLSESASWWWLLGLAAGYAAWMAGSWLWLRHMRRDAGAEGLVEGEGRVSGWLSAEGPVLVGEPFTLRLPSGVGLLVRPGPHVRARTATVRPWERSGRLLPGEALTVEGVLARELSERVDGYREAEARWTLLAARIESTVTADHAARGARRARLSLALSLAALGTLGLVSVRFVALALAGEAMEGRVEVWRRTRSGVVPHGTYGHRLASSDELGAEVTLLVDDELWSFDDSLTEAGYRELGAAGRAPVITARIGDVRIAQIGERPGLPALVPYGGVLPLVALLGWLWWRRGQRAPASTPT